MFIESEYPLCAKVRIGMMSSKLQYEEEVEEVQNLTLSIGGRLLTKIFEELDSETQAKRRRM